MFSYLQVAYLIKGQRDFVFEFSKNKLVNKINLKEK